MKQRYSLLGVCLLLGYVAGCALSADGRGAARANAPDSDRTAAENSKLVKPAESKEAASSAPSVGKADSAKKEDNKSAVESPHESGGNPNLKAPTFGGKFYWTDELVYFDWRIQRHAENGHYRLIDQEGKRHAWGTFDECRSRLETIKREQNLPPLSGKVVLVLHGLVRSRTSGSNMVEYIGQNSTYTAMTVGYASTQADVASHAKALARVVENLGDKVEEISFVAHSLGNIVIRHYLADQADAANGRRPDPRIKRIVMVGPPNNGARMAEIFGRNSVFERIVGQSGQAIASHWQDLAKHLAVPQVEFGIIAGGRRDEEGYNPLLLGDDDLILSVEETKLKGARDFLVVEGLHAFLMSYEDVHKSALRFLEYGYFVAEDKRQPL
jgi:pimeloyl-ACP methyl ester carboxylesterase